MHFRLPILTFVLFISFSYSFGQEFQKFGELNSTEIEFTQYDKDSLADAVVLYEQGNNYFEVINHRIQLVKKYHVRIKILNEEGFEKANISIPFYRGENLSEKVEEIRAITHNGTIKTGVSSDKIYSRDISERWSEKTFTFPKVEQGSILEYMYTVVSPFIYNLNGWDFQSDIPKLYSEFNAKIPGNYNYNRTMIGPLKLDINDSSIETNCFYVDGISKAASCEVMKYAMKDIPAFKREEGYMLAASNYISRIDFELAELTRLNGTREKFTKTWKDVDSEFRADKNIGRQLTKKGFFEKNVPENLFIETDQLKKAKEIYEFVQNHYTWNQKYGIYQKARVKTAFESKKGNVSEINISLINLLNAADIETNLVLLSTRNAGLPKKNHPVMSDFNYVVAKTTINGKDYLLDATDKYIAFGMLPFRALNYYGRVMDFKNDSYWFDIIPETRNKCQVRAQIEFNKDTNSASGIFDINNHGYEAVSKRKVLDKYDQDSYLEVMESEFEEDFFITSYKLSAQSNRKKIISERFEFEIENVFEGDMIYFNPFFIRFFEKNPFQLEERNYPVDFGYQRNYGYQISVLIPEGYSLHSLPEKKVIQLGNKIVVLKFYLEEKLGRISIFFDFSLNNTYIPVEEYDGLRKVFREVVDIQRNSLIVFKREE